MRFIIPILLCLIILITIGHTQEKKTTVIKSNMTLDRSKPSVYITFERLGGVPPIVKSDEDGLERITLRMHNNTVRPIVVEANYDIGKVKDFEIKLQDGTKVSALPNGTEVELCYESEAMPQMTAEEFFKIKVPKQVPSFYSCKLQATGRGRGNSWIPSGSSILFGVPRSFLGKNLKIYTLFNYEWESENGQMNANEPYHQAYFYSNELPYHLQLKSLNSDEPSPKRRKLR